MLKAHNPARYSICIVLSHSIYFSFGLIISFVIILALVADLFSFCPFLNSNNFKFGRFFHFQKSFNFCQTILFILKIYNPENPQFLWVTLYMSKIAGLLKTVNFIFFFIRIFWQFIKLIEG